MKKVGGFGKAKLCLGILALLASCISAKGQSTQESLTARESKLILKMSEHKLASEQYVALIKSLYARNPNTLTEAYEKYLQANSKFNAFVNTLGLYLVDRPKDARDKVFKDLANETDLVAREFQSYARELIDARLPNTSGARTRADTLQIFGPSGKWDLFEVLPKIYKIATEMFEAEKKRKREARVRFVSNMKEQTVWREWSRIDPAFGQNQ